MSSTQTPLKSATTGSTKWRYYASFAIALLYSMTAIRPSLTALAPIEDCGHPDILSDLPTISDVVSSKTNWSYSEIFNPALNDASQICVPWTMNMDSWWTHHPEWSVQSETDDSLCFSREDSEKTRMLRELYEIQFVHGNCSDVHTKHMWGSGLAADLDNVVDGLLHGLATKRPFQITFDDRLPDTGWHYASTKTGDKPVCPTKDMFCFFLPLGRCPPGKIDRTAFRQGAPFPETKHMMYEYLLRPQQWLRQRVLEYVRDEAPRIDAPCAVIHVRRADVVLHNDFARNYFAIDDYLQQLRTNDIKHKTILLLTDDANAIDEAWEFHPEYNWKYLNRTRHRGKEGGWENQLPSKDPVKEMVVLLSTFQLIKQCDTIVHGHGGFSEMLYMKMNFRRENGVTRLRVEKDLERDSIFDSKHESAMDDLQTRLEEKRQEKRNVEAAQMDPDRRQEQQRKAAELSTTRNEQDTTSMVE